MKAFAVSLLCLTSSIVYAQNAQAGAYVQTSDKWEKLYIANTEGLKSKGVAKSAFSYGIASAKIVLMYREPDAPVKTQGPRPIFKIVGPTMTAPRDIVIVRLKQEKDHRELQVASTRVWTGINSSYPPEDTVAVDVKQDGDTMIITPKADLKPGQYMLFAATPTAMPAGYGGYDFTVN
jgi:hypothetical protein